MSVWKHTKPVVPTSVTGQPFTRQEVLLQLQEDPIQYEAYLQLSDELKEELLAFAMGTAGLHITYDPVFKMVFDPEAHPERLEELLSLWLKQKVTILKALPLESSRLMEEGSLLIMDLLVQLTDGSLVNVEIQRAGYLFPGQRCACYSSDLLMRQYSRVRAQSRKQKTPFSYKDIHRVYTIVLIANSTAEFHAFPEQYMHYARQTFDTGLPLDLLQEYLLIPLDIFKKNIQNKGIQTKADAWLMFISSNSMADIRKVLDAFPEFAEMYRQVFQFRFQKGELIQMYSKALSILDRNTVHLMIEQYQEEIENQKAQLLEKDKSLAEKDRTLEAQGKFLAEKDKSLAEKDAEIARLREMCGLQSP